MDFKEEFKSLKTLHMAMFFGIVVICLVLYLLTDSTKIEMSFDMSLLEGAVLMLSFAVPGAFQLAYRKRLSALKEIEGDVQRWEAFRQLQVTRYATIEGPALVCVVFFYLQGAMFFFILALTYGFVLYNYRPTKVMIEYETGLKIEDN